MTSNKPYSLNKSERLKSRKQIESLFETGEKITEFPIRLSYLVGRGPDSIKAGFTVSAKNFPRAVDRNRIKRLCRESYRTQKKDLENFIVKTQTVLSLFFIYTGKEIISYEEISLVMKKILIKLIKALHADHPENT